MSQDCCPSDFSTAFIAPSKPIFECVPSQNGLLVEPPHRHSATRSRPLVSTELPSASFRLIGPLTRYGPFVRMVISTSAIVLPRQCSRGTVPQGFPGRIAASGLDNKAVY